MKKYNWFQKVGHSLVPSEFYIQVLQEKMRYAVGYMIIFILILSVSAGIYTGLQDKIGMDATALDYTNGVIPQMSLLDGELTIEGAETITIDHFDTYIVLDDAYNYNINDVLVYDDFILFQKTGFSFMSKGVGPIVYKYKDTFFLDLNAEDIGTILNILASLMIPVAIMSQFTLSIASFFFNSLFVLLIGNILRTISGLGLRLKQVYHMVIYAMTFSVFWVHFTTLLPGQVPLWLDNFVYYTIPSLILMTVFMMIRKRAVEELSKKNNRS